MASRRPNTQKKLRFSADVIFQVLKNARVVGEEVTIDNIMKRVSTLEKETKGETILIDNDKWTLVVKR